MGAAPVQLLGVTAAASVATEMVLDAAIAQQMDEASSDDDHVRREVVLLGTQGGGCVNEQAGDQRMEDHRDCDGGGDREAPFPRGPGP